jgi:predicted dehydrogenase
MRFGLVGTGPWAGIAHGPGLVACPVAELVGVWGRDPGKAADLAGRLDTRPYADVDELFADVDAVAFAVPPAIQSGLAIRAAQVGKHLLLDKPIALDVESADALESTAAAAGVASVVFFTDRFVDTSRAWFDQVQGTLGWRGGWYRWLSTLQAPDNPFGGSAWRQAKGALWDTGPHALSTLIEALGPVAAITATPGDGDLVTLVIRHESGATSTVTLSQFAPPAAASFDCTLWGEAGLAPMPPRPDGAIVEVYAAAATDLVTAAGTGAPTRADVRLGATIVRLIADAQAQIDRQRASAG